MIRITEPLTPCPLTLTLGAFLFMDYKELLKHPYWQKKRLEILQRDNFACVKCTDQFSNLQIHHLYYEANRFPWEYPNECFQTLCELCHEKAEFMKWMLREGITFLRKDFPDIEIDRIYTTVEGKVNSNYHAESVRAYIDAIKNTIKL